MVLALCASESGQSRRPARPEACMCVKIGTVCGNQSGVSQSDSEHESEAQVAHLLRCWEHAVDRNRALSPLALPEQ